MTDTLAVPGVPDVTDAPSRHRAGLALLALAVGGFAIGTTEFVTMGLLPEVAAGTGVDIPTAGHFISAYALGVVVGAPLIAVLAARLRRKTILLALMVGFAVANAASGFATDYTQLMVARFLSGVPHGAFFGIGSLVAASLVPKERRTWAISMMLIGLGTANIIGVPVTTVLGQNLGWAVPYWVVGGIGLVTVLAVWAWVPWQSTIAEATMRTELSALTRLQVWLALLIGVVGFGGMFATYSFITPDDDGAVGLLRVVRAGDPRCLRRRHGAGHGGERPRRPPGRAARDHRLARRHRRDARAVRPARPQPAARGRHGLRARLPPVHPRAAAADPVDGRRPRGQSLAAALNHSTLNMANALGAWLGSLVLAAGLGYEWPSRVGALLAVLGVGIAVLSAVLGRRSGTSADPANPA